MKYFSMFSGIGGFELGIQRAMDSKQLAQIKQDRERRNRNIDEQEVCLLPTEDTSLCVGFSEIDKYSIQTYEKNFRGHKNYGNATQINPDELPDFDLLCGGFPCQAFSIAGKRRGFKDTRGTLFFDIARILKVKRPKLVFLENVKGLLNHNKGETFTTILQTLDELGYEVQWMVLNSKFFGVPQNRERVFIIGSIRGEPRPEILPFGEVKGETVEIIKEIDTGHQGNTVYGIDGISSTLNAYGGGQGGKTGLYGLRMTREEMLQSLASEGLEVTEKGKESFDKVFPVLTPNRENKRQNGRRFKEDGEPSFTLTGQDKHGVMITHPTLPTELAHSTGRDYFRGAGEKIFKASNQIRRLTPTECERLQGFPDGWSEGVSDTQRYKQLGNAVTVNVIEAIMKKLMP